MPWRFRTASSASPTATPPGGGRQCPRAYERIRIARWTASLKGALVRTYGKSWKQCESLSPFPRYRAVSKKGIYKEYLALPLFQPANIDLINPEKTQNTESHNLSF